MSFSFTALKIFDDVVCALESGRLTTVKKMKIMNLCMITGCGQLKLS